MFNDVWSPEAKATYDLLKSKAEASLQTRKRKGKAKSSLDEGLFKQVHKTIGLLKDNPRHPGLHTHEYDSIQNPYDEKQKVVLREPCGNDL